MTPSSRTCATPASSPPPRDSFSIPEGDTLHRTAAALHKWIAGRQVTGAASQRIPAERLVGDEVDAVEARGKHLMIRFSGGLTLHTHMRMTGSWHLYGMGETWRKPKHLARVVLEFGDRVAVCFSAPVIELIPTQTEWAHPILAGLGPDVMTPPVDIDEVKRRASEQPVDVPIGDLLLDQQVVAGIGNIWRNEALFVCQVNPATPHTRVDVGELVRTASRLMQARARLGVTYRPKVYNRAGRPCPRCGGRIEAARQGRHARTAYWCPRCQLL